MKQITNPGFLSDDDLFNVMTEASGGLIIVVECDCAQVLYVSETVEDVLNIAQVWFRFQMHHHTVLHVLYVQCTVDCHLDNSKDDKDAADDD